ncbi:UNVERIFIED_CONTAM: hypothetical protein RF648_06300 [Kocuria sp. CPCC 205274]
MSIAQPGGCGPGPSSRTVQDACQVSAHDVVPTIPEAGESRPATPLEAALRTALSH